MRFALDQNYPLPIVAALQEYMTEAELVALADIDSVLTDIDDWQVLPSLHHHPLDWDGLITTDSGILSLPREVAVLLQTRLTLVVADAAGHDPLKATGLVLTYLPWIAAHSRRDEAQVWVLRARNQPPKDPWELIRKIADRRGVTPQTLYEAEKLTPREFATDPLA